MVMNHMRFGPIESTSNKLRGGSTSYRASFHKLNYQVYIQAVHRYRLWIELAFKVAPYNFMTARELVTNLAGD